jgi:hypothetical protein
MPRPSPWRSVVALLVSLAACGGDNKSLGQNVACKSSGECAVGLICDSGQCRTACNVDQDCPVGNHCSYGLCVPLPKGVCAQAGDCISPPDTCHIIAGATCDGGSCTYPRKNGTTCGAPCGFDGDCDPLTHGLDRCSNGACSNHVCVFTTISNCPYKQLATLCAQDNDCASGHCADGLCCDTACNGVCAQCNAHSGHCEKPDDDITCGIIDCDGLDNICRNYQDLTNATHHRCADIGTCAQANNANDCVVYLNNSDGAVCHDSTGPCDIPESCVAGICPSDAMVATGGQCIGNESDDDPGICDSAQHCFQLTTLGSGDRYFLEESAASDDR